MDGKTRKIRNMQMEPMSYSRFVDLRTILIFGLFCYTKSFSNKVFISILIVKLFFFIDSINTVVSPE